MRGAGALVEGGGEVLTLEAPVEGVAPWERPDPFGSLQAIREERLRRGLPVFDLSMINPDEPPARFLVDKLLEATVRPGSHRYAVSRGIHKLRAAFATRYKARYEVDVDADREVCVTMGCKDAILHVLPSLARPGSGVLLASPTYPAHLSAVYLARLRPTFFPFSDSEDRVLSEIAVRLETVRGIRVLLLNVPNNPTGRVVSKEFLDELGTLLRRFDVYLVNDFVYGDLVFPGASQPSVLTIESLKGRALEAVSMSKSYSVPGWRVGALAGPAEVVQHVARRKAHIDYGNFLPIQVAASAALTHSEDLTRDICDLYSRRARVAQSTLRQMGWGVPEIHAGASVWIKLSGSTAVNGGAFAERLLEKSGVVVSPGEVFGSEWTGHLRIALVLPDEILRSCIAAFAGCV